jgi:hypothetical protein
MKGKGNYKVEIRK